MTRHHDMTFDPTSTTLHFTEKVGGKDCIGVGFHSDDWQMCGCIMIECDPITQEITINPFSVGKITVEDITRIIIQASDADFTVEEDDHASDDEQFPD